MGGRILRSSLGGSSCKMGRRGGKEREIFPESLGGGGSEGRAGGVYQGKNTLVERDIKGKFAWKKEKGNGIAGGNTMAPLKKMGGSSHKQLLEDTKGGSGEERGGKWEGGSRRGLKKTGKLDEKPGPKKRKFSSLKDWEDGTG